MNKKITDNFVIEGDIVNKRNKYDGLFYSYDVKAMDNTNKWNPFLHKEDGRKIDWQSKQCSYCKYAFTTEEELKRHLGFMDIDVKNWMAIIRKRFPSTRAQVDEVDELVEKMAKAGIKRRWDDEDDIIKRFRKL